MIKQVNLSDASVLLLSRKCFDELRKIYKPTEEAKRNKSKSSDDWTCYGYFINDELAGVIDVKLQDNELQLSSLAIEPKYRRNGFSRKLIAGAASYYSGINILSVWCVEQTGNVAIFEALGFSVVERLESELFEVVDGSKAIEVQLKQRATV